MTFRRRSTTDTGTVVLHWLLVLFFGALVLTGLRLASDEQGLRWLARLDPILPVENLWLIHLGAGVGFTALLAGYCSYMLRARLSPRVRFGRVQLTNLLGARGQRWGAAGLLAYWIFAVAAVTEVLTGLLQFYGYGGLTLTLHLVATWVCLGFPVAHIAAHAASGGADQLARIVRPARLIVPRPAPDFAALLAQHLVEGGSSRQVSSQASAAAPERRRPLLWAGATAVSVTALVLATEPLTRQVLVVERIAVAAAPRLDGDLSDAAWADAPVTRVLTQHGANFGPYGETIVEIRAVHDGTRAYFAFTWDDPTRSLKHLPLVKRSDGWHLLLPEPTDNSNTFIEDKFSVLLVRPLLPLIGAAIHLAAQPLADKPSGISGRGLHYIGGGGMADVWQWHADRPDMIDDGYFASPTAPTEDQLAGRARYTGGYVAERGQRHRRDNFDVPIADYTQLVGPIRPLRVPKGRAITLAALGQPGGDAHINDGERAEWSMRLDESVPYSAAADQAVPQGTVIPGELIVAGNSDVAAAARWSAGRWTLTVARTLKPPKPHEIPILSGTMMWVAAFDHDLTRHTRHMRPIILEVQDGEAP